MTEKERAMCDKIAKFAKGYRSYRPCAYDWPMVLKVWNNGMGALDFYRVYEDKRIICVNRFLWKSTDQRKLDDLKRTLGGEWKIVWCNFGYPEFYNNHLSLKYAINESERNT